MPNYVPLELPPGVVVRPTKASKSSFWREVNLIRWENGRMQPVGGWEGQNYTAFDSRNRRIHDWESNSSVRFLAFLCEGQLYVDIAGELIDISPTPAIEPPNANISAGGYGTDLFGKGKFGTARPDRPRDKKITPAFTMDNWGEDLIVQSSVDGRLLRWKPSAPSDSAEAVPNAPLGRTFVVTPERHVIMFGVDGDPRKFAWCDEEDLEDWNYADLTSKAGFFNVEPASPIVSACKCLGGVLFHTARRAYMINPIGLPYIYNYEDKGASSTPISAASIVMAGDNTIWVSDNGFWQFNGVAITPLDCPIWGWIDKQINPVYSRYEASMVDLVGQGEIWWFFTSKESRYNDRVAIYNYRDGWWAMGKISRACGVGSSYTSYPIMSDGNTVFLHEKGIAYPGITDGAWAETFTLNSRDGGNISTLLSIIPDVEGNPDNLAMRVYRAMKRSQNSDGTSAESLSVRRFIRSDGKVDLRETARDLRLRIETTSINGNDWTLGQMLIDMRRRGAGGKVGA